MMSVIFLNITMCVCSVPSACLTLLDPIDRSLPGSSVHGILQARILSFPPPGDLPDPGVKPESPAFVGGFFTTSTIWEAQTSLWIKVKTALRLYCSKREDRESG